MTEKPFRDEDVIVRGKDFCLTPEASDFRLWVRRGNNWYKDYRVPAWAVEVIRQLQASQERCGRLEDALRDIAGTEGANEYDAPAIARAALRKPRKKAALARQEKGGGE